jgi:hypothetical protein
MFTEATLSPVQHGFGLPLIIVEARALTHTRIKKLPSRAATPASPEKEAINNGRLTQKSQQK